MYSEIASIYHEIFPLNNAFLKFIREYLGAPGSRILDLGCGPGDYINILTPKYEGVGIDPDPEMIRIAQSRNQGKFYNLSFLDIDRLDGPFSCAFCVGNSLSYLPHDRETEFYGMLSGKLSESAFFVIQVVNWDRYRLTGKMDFPVKTLEDGRTFHRAYAPSENNTVHFNTMLKQQDRMIGTWSDTLYPKTMDDFRRKLKLSGIDVVEAYGDYDKTPFSPSSSPASILVARKTK